MMRRLVLLLGILFFAFSGLANAAKNPGQLRPTQAIGYYLLAKDVTFKFKPPHLFSGNWTWGLHAGKYTPKFENDEGVYFQADGTPVICLLNVHSMGDYAGGIFVPKDRKVKPSLWYYFKRDSSLSGGLLVDWLISTGVGKINFFPPNGQLAEEDFLSEIDSAFHSENDATK